MNYVNLASILHNNLTQEMEFLAKEVIFPAQLKDPHLFSLYVLNVLSKGFPGKSKS